MGRKPFLTVTSFNLKIPSLSISRLFIQLGFRKYIIFPKKINEPLFNFLNYENFLDTILQTICMLQLNSTQAGNEIYLE